MKCGRHCPLEGQEVELFCTGCFEWLLSLSPHPSLSHQSRAFLHSPCGLLFVWYAIWSGWPLMGVPISLPAQLPS